MGRDRTLGFGSIPQGGTRVNPIDSPVHPMGLWDGTGHWDLEVWGTGFWELEWEDAW